LSKVSNEQLAIALHGASTNLIAQLLANKTKGAQDMLNESMSLSQKMPEKQIQEARQIIVRTARQLIKDGYITHRKPKKVEAYIV
jgi:flagellar motor switch protein FliG